MSRIEDYRVGAQLTELSQILSDGISWLTIATVMCRFETETKESSQELCLVVDRFYKLCKALSAPVNTPTQEP